MRTGYEISFNDFCYLLSEASYRIKVAPLLQDWFQYQVVPLEKDFALLNRTGVELSPRDVYSAIQSNRDQQYQLYQTAMSLWR